jgi:hypothetical protein
LFQSAISFCGENLYNTSAREKAFKPCSAHIHGREARKMTENEKEKAAKPQSDWDGYIIPHRTAASSDI